jgi:hypothetical protein
LERSRVSTMLAIKNSILSNLDTPASYGPTVPIRMPTNAPTDLIGQLFLKDAEAYGQRLHTKIMTANIGKDSEQKPDPNHIRSV